jgi:2-methylcitrate dehydratase PrpD
MGITTQVAEFIAKNSYADMSAEAVNMAKRAILDTIGCALAGAKDPAGKIITEFVKSESGNPVSTVILGGFKTAPSQAALANGVISHALDFDDIVRGGPGHNSVGIVPVILSLGESENASGKDVLAAYIMGFEIAAKIGVIMGLPHWNDGWHSTSSVGTFGSVAAASKLLNLDARQVAMALAIAASHASGLRQQFGTMMKPFHAGMACRAGLVSARLAKSGFVGGENILEAKAGYFKVLGRKDDKDFENLHTLLGNPWSLQSPGVYFKPFACGGANHPAIYSILEVAKKYNVTADQVVSIDAKVPDMVMRECLHHHPQTALEGKFSQEFTVAIALLEGSVLLSQVTDEKVRAPETQSLIEKIKVVEHKATPSDPYSLTVTLKTGEKYVEEIGDVDEVLKRNLSEEEIIAKYRDCASLALAPNDVENSIRLVQNLEQLSDIKQLTSILAKRTK